MVFILIMAKFKNQKNNRWIDPSLAKIFFVRTLAKLARGIRVLQENFKPNKKSAESIYKPFQKTGWFFLSIVVVPVYKLYFLAKKILTKLYAPQLSRHWMIHLFSRRYLIHLILTVFVFATVTQNLNASEKKQEDLGSNSIVALLASTEDLGTLEEQGPITEGKKITRYTTEASLSSQDQLNEEFQQDIAPQVITGSSAIVQQIISPVEEDMRKSGEIVYYIVQTGDTISDIAEKFGVSASTILWENNLTSYSLIRPGDKLAILPSSGIRHKVAKGETLAKIAKKYGVAEDKIITANKLASAADIKVGESLLIPGGKKTYVATPATTVNQGTYVPSTTIVSTGSLMWPNSCRRISQYFGWRHSGLDIACPFSSALYAADSGVVIRAQGGWNGGYGNMIMIAHGNGIQTVYGHLTKIYVEVGQTVEKGEQIGLEGSTGRSTGPHLHFEVRVGGVRRNPLSYVK